VDAKEYRSEVIAQMTAFPAGRQTIPKIFQRPGIYIDSRAMAYGPETAFSHRRMSLKE
jgi:hypothetical protein